MTYQFWQHIRSGEVYAVKLDAAGRVVAANGPLDHTDYVSGDPQTIAENAYEPDLADGLDGTQDDYRLWEGVGR